MKQYTITGCDKLQQVLDSNQRTTHILIEGENIQVSDKYHTFEDMYRHRYELFIALCKIYDNYITPLSTRVKCWKSKLHSDGTLFVDSFLMGMSITQFDGHDEQITYHLPMRYWNLVNLMELPKAPPYDGHTSDDVLMRLRRL